MTATDELRRMLDEREVEWRGGLPNETIITDPIDVLYVQRTDGMIHVYIRSYLTPEQAVAATLGDVPRLPYFWTADGTLHIELPKLPESISVRLPDQRDREVGSARTWQYTQGIGTCRTVYLVEISDDLLESWYTIAVYQCHEAAESRAEALRREVDGVRHFARVSKLEVVDA